MTCVYLASSSSRRSELLIQAGFDVCICRPSVDDSQLDRGSVSSEQWIASLAYAKAISVWPDVSDQLGDGDILLAADTVCVAGGDVLGQPINAADARRMLFLLRSATHQTMTGVCLLSHSSARQLFVDSATVEIGDVSDDQIDLYIQGEQWRGKAGGYNLADRIDAGWSIRCDGDPATVMGLPLQRLKPILSGMQQCPLNSQAHM